MARRRREKRRARANAQWKKWLAEYEAPPLDPAIDEALKDFVREEESVDAGRVCLRWAMLRR